MAGEQVGVFCFLLTEYFIPAFAVAVTTATSVPDHLEATVSRGRVQTKHGLVVEHLVETVGSAVDWGRKQQWCGWRYEQQFQWPTAQTEGA